MNTQAQEALPINSGRGERFAATNGYASWVIILYPATEPIVKRCSSQKEEVMMMQQARKFHPTAQLICAQTNPVDPNELWATSEAHWKAVNEA